MFGGRARRTALALGGRAGWGRDQEGIVLLVEGPLGPLRLWLILLILLLHQRDWGGVEKSKRGRGWKPSGQALSLRPPPPGQARNLEIGDSLASPGQVCLGPGASPQLSSLHADTSWGLGSRKWGPEAPWPNPTLPGTPPPQLGVTAILWDTWSPAQPRHLSPGAVPHSSLLLAPSGARSVAPQQLPEPLPQAADREGAGPVKAAGDIPQIPTLGSSWLIRGRLGFVGSAARISN